MELVIDANVVKGYFEEIHQHPLELTAKPSPLFQRLGSEDRAYLDEGGHIKQEWRNLVEPEWFDRWYTDLLRSDGIQLIPVQNWPGLRKKLEGKGFPRGKDFWYLRTAKAVLDLVDQVVFVTEDIDFYSPKDKKSDSKYRQQILLSGNGSIAKYLNHKETIHIVCVATYLEQIESAN